MSLSATILCIVFFYFIQKHRAGLEQGSQPMDGMGFWPARVTVQTSQIKRVLTLGRTAGSVKTKSGNPHHGHRIERAEKF